MTVDVAQLERTNTLLERKRYRAPANDGEALIEPSVKAARQLWQDNVQVLQANEGTIRDRSLQAMRATAQNELLELATRYSSQYLAAEQVNAVRARAESDSGGDFGFILSGHQPELFHPGVWAKNFGLSSLGEQLGVATMNLIIDNDLCSNPSIKVPTGSMASPRITSVPFDRVEDPMPWEHRQVADKAMFDSFSDRVSEQMLKTNQGMLVDRVWDLATDEQLSGMSLGQRLAASRHQLEHSIGVSNLEVPLSQVCDTQSFRSFAAGILTDPVRFVEVHNSALHQYRRINRLRSQTHPVPDLQSDHGWFEMPFWVWHRDTPVRRPLYVRIDGEAFQLSDRASFEQTITAGGCTAQLESLADRKYVIRPRALTTTMYARLVLSSLFVHGIGGAKYDQLTDQIILQFFGMTPPGFQVLTATLRLPYHLPPFSVDDLRRERGRVRELRYHPELFVDTQVDSGDNQEACELAAKKKRLIREQPVEGSKRAWHLELTRINELLQPFVREQRDRIEAEITEHWQGLRRRDLLESREFSFVLHPESICAALEQLVN